jgi:hypothetical protein
LRRRDRLRAAWYCLRVQHVVRLVVVVMVLFHSACSPCRAVETRALALECADGAPFEGERHFDRQETFTTFLEQECGIATDPARALATTIDFNVDAVVVARGDRFSNNRCLDERSAESVEVCDAGLRITFDDVESATSTCAGSQWTVAVVVGRADLRAALAD